MCPTSGTQENKGVGLGAPGALHPSFPGFPQAGTRMNFPVLEKTTKFVGEHVAESFAEITSEYTHNDPPLSKNDFSVMVLELFEPFANAEKLFFGNLDGPLASQFRPESNEKRSEN